MHGILWDPKVGQLDRKSVLFANDALLCFRGRSRTAATSKMELFVIIVNGFQTLSTKSTNEH